MEEPIDYRKQYKQLYVPPSKPVIVDVPPMLFAMLSGSGDPNGEAFAQATEALYSLSYAVRMSYKSDETPVGYYQYKVFPLEGVWDLKDRSVSAKDKSNFRYTIMIRQPDFVTEEWFRRFIEQTMKKKPNPYLAAMTLDEVTDGLSCQMMHLGSFDDEPASFARMQEFCDSNGYERASLTHREIYLSDPRKTESAKLKTVLRFRVRQR